MSQAAAATLGRELVLGRYRPLKPLGSGGSGSVWLARDEATGLEVALKIVAREGKAAPRAEREAVVAGRLRHERCLRAYALSQDEGHVYIAYEYVAGETMREAMRGGRLDDAAAVEAAAQILEGLAYAHAHGVVHRDVKPANVLLADGGGVSVRLLDFGLALLEEAETLTAMGDVPGTLAYIAPERLAGEPATAASDVWSAGVLLWEALAGGHPFWKASLLESARAIERGAPPLESVRPDLPRPLLAAVGRALAPDPRRRPPAAKLAAELRGAQKRRPQRPAVRVSVPPARQLAARVAPAALAAAWAGWSAHALPFYPHGFAPALAALAAAATLVRPRLGVALALAVPVLPLGNLGLGVAALYAAVAAAWLLVFLREPRGALVVAAGPLLAPVSALGLLPLAAAPLRSPLLRALAAGAGVLLAALVAGIRGAPLPFTGAQPPLGLGLAGSERPLAVGAVLLHELAARPALLLVAGALAAIALLLPLAAARGPWGAAGVAAALLATMLVAPGAAALPLLLTAWATWLVLTLKRAS